MLTDKELNMKEELWNSAFMKLTAGANMEEASGEMKVMLEIRPSNSHLRESGKLRGISGSSWDSHPTIPLSRSERGRFAGSRRAFLLREVRAVVIRDNLLLVLALEFILLIESPSPSFLGPASIDVED
jgi:hypothetical protein